jgi:hypothetical protein
VAWSIKSKNIRYEPTTKRSTVTACIFLNCWSIRHKGTLTDHLWGTFLFLWHYPPTHFKATWGECIDSFFTSTL